MRLWHKDLIPVLPKKQLLGQWRECCAIARNIAVHGTPKHLLVNKVMAYPLELDFYMYGEMVIAELKKRGYTINSLSLNNYYEHLQAACNNAAYKWDPDHEVFAGWHNDKYLLQCFYNLQEKYDCGGIPEDEWHAVDVLVKAKETKYFIEHATKDPLGYALKSNDPAAVYNRRFIIESEWRKDNG